jgi:hypothetical protein
MCLIYPVQIVVGGVSINNEVLVVASLISRYIGPVSHSLVEVHMGSVCVPVLIRVRACECLYVFCNKKDPFRFIPNDFSILII